MTAKTLTRRELNRATLERQLLLRRHTMPTLEAIERLAGMQAQTVHTWYVGLWSRLDGFEPESASELLTGRQAVRIALMRSTIHLVSARDCLAWRPLVEPVIERSMNGNFGRQLAGIDVAELTAAGRELVEEQPRTFSELGRALAERWPGRDPVALAQAIRTWVPLVQVPPRGVWGASGAAAHTSAESWLGAPLQAEPSVEELCLRYLAAFGPASVMDIQTWCGLTRLGEVVERLRPRLIAFRDEHGRELFDLPDAPRPDPDTPAPPRFLYDFDNLLLSHADRSRFMADARLQPGFAVEGSIPQALLVDGVVAGTWKVDRQRDAATLAIRPLGTLSGRDEAALAEEGERLLGFLAAGTESRDVSFLTSS
jgi:hypothetical protein